MLTYSARHATGALGVTKVTFEDTFVNFWHGAQGNKLVISLPEVGERHGRPKE